METLSNRLLKLKQLIEIVANLSLITAVVVALTFFARHHGTLHAGTNSASPRTLSRESQIGRSISLPGVDWGSHKATLVVAISTACHFCVHSAPFYSSLTQGRHPTPVVVVMPQSRQDAEVFLKKHSINPAKTISEDLSDLQVEGTPTLLLVSSSGAVTQSWVGELTQVQQQQVTSALATL